ncbi:hypothetical protein QFZ27_000730 [Inquilinus ginsengisoli]
MRIRILVPVLLAVAAILVGGAGFLLVYSKDPSTRPVVSGALPGAARSG